MIINSITLNPIQNFIESDINSVEGFDSSDNSVSFTKEDSYWKLDNCNINLSSIKLKSESDELLAEGSIDLNMNLINELRISIELNSNFEFVSGSGIILELSYESHLDNPNDPTPNVSELVGKHLDQGLLESDFDEVTNYTDRITNIPFSQGSKFKIVESFPAAGEIQISSIFRYSTVKDLTELKPANKFHRKYIIPTDDEILNELSQRSLVNPAMNLYRNSIHRMRLASDDNLGLFKYLVVSDDSAKIYRVIIAAYEIVGYVDLSTSNLLKVKVYNFKSKLDISSKFLPNIFTNFENILIQSGKDLVGMRVTGSTVQGYTEVYEGIEKSYPMIIPSDSDIAHVVFDVNNLSCCNPFEGFNAIDPESLKVNEQDYDFEDNKPLNYFHEFLNYDTPIVMSRVISKLNCINFIFGYENNPKDIEIQLFDEFVLYISNEFLNYIIYSDYPQIKDYSEYSDESDDNYNDKIIGRKQLYLNCKCESEDLSVNDINYINSANLNIEILYIKNDNLYLRNIDIANNTDEINKLEENKITSKIKYRGIEGVR